MTAPLVGALTLLALVACGRKDTGEAPAPPGVAITGSASARPVDHLAPGELLESDQKAFGLVLPGALHINQRLMGRVIASSTSPPEDLANFFRARVGGGKILVGSTSTQFLHVRARSDPSRELDIRVEKDRGGTRVDILDVSTPPTPTPSNSGEARKQVGLSPDGKLLDPKHLE